MPISCAHLMCPSDVVIVALGGTGLEYKALCLVGEERGVGVEWGASPAPRRGRCKATARQFVGIRDARLKPTPCLHHPPCACVCLGFCVCACATG